VAQRRVESCQNVAVHLRGSADDLQLHLPAERVGEIAHHPRQSPERRPRTVSCGMPGLIVESMRKIDAAPIEHLELDETLRQEIFALCHLTLRLAERLLR
jgi:hypothetical protein